MDLCLFAKNNGISVELVAETLGFKSEQIQRVYNDIDTKRSTTQYLHLSPLLIDDISEIKKE